MNRYRNDTIIKNGTTIETNRLILRLRTAIKNNNIACTERYLRDGERLDTIAYQYYGDGGLWWVIAAASNIGWWLQVPPGTLLRIPVDLNSFSNYI
jgi:nucleoid-associated protein YgaU